MQDLEHILQRQKYLENLNPEFIRFIVGCASNVRFKTNDYIFHEGEEAKHFYIIRKGLVVIQMPLIAGKTPTIQSLGENDILGWSWLFPPYHWHFSAFVKKDTRAIALDGECLRNKCEQNHELGFELMKRFSHIVNQRLQSAREQILDIYTQTSRYANINS